MSALAVGGTTTGGTSVCYGNNSGSVTLSGQTGSVSKWQFSTDGGSTWTDITNTATSQSYSSLIVTTRYRAVITNGACTAVSTASIITVSPLSVGGSAPDQLICTGSTPANIVLTGNVGSVVKWQRSTDSTFPGNRTTDITNTSTTLPGSTIGALTQTTYVRAVVQSSPCAAVNSSVITISVAGNSVGGTV